MRCNLLRKKWLIFKLIHLFIRIHLSFLRPTQYRGAGETACDEDSLSQGKIIIKSAHAVCIHYCLWL